MSIIHPYDRLIAGGMNSNFSPNDPTEKKNKNLPLSQRVVVVARNSIPKNQLASSEPLKTSHTVTKRSSSASSSASSNDISAEPETLTK